MGTTDASQAIVRGSAATDDEAERCFVLWPHRSLPRSGLAMLMACVTLVVMLPLLKVPGPALWMVAVPCLSVPAALALAFWCNNRAARIKELVAISPGQVRIVRTGPASRERIDLFNPYWVRLEVRSDRRIAHRILLAEGQRRVAIGDYLSPEERLDLAQSLRKVLAAARTGSDRAPGARS